MKVFIGIDPGKDGAVAVITEQGKFVAVHDTPMLKVKRGPKIRREYLEAPMAEMLRSIMEQHIVRGVVIEAVHAMPKQGVTSMFSMGTGFGIWLGILAALQLPYVRVEPRTWKKDVGIATGSDKAESIVRALRLIPDAAVYLSRAKDDGRADALLMALWHSRVAGRP